MPQMYGGSTRKKTLAMAQEVAEEFKAADGGQCTPEVEVWRNGHPADSATPYTAVVWLDGPEERLAWWRDQAEESEFIVSFNKQDGRHTVKRREGKPKVIRHPDLYRQAKDIRPAIRDAIRAAGLAGNVSPLGDHRRVEVRVSLTGGGVPERLAFREIIEAGGLYTNANALRYWPFKRAASEYDDRRQPVNTIHVSTAPYEAVTKVKLPAERVVELLRAEGYADAEIAGALRMAEEDVRRLARKAEQTEGER
jgi:hypothetical protein